MLLALDSERFSRAALKLRRGVELRSRLASSTMESVADRIRLGARGVGRLKLSESARGSGFRGSCPLTCNLAPGSGAGLARLGFCSLRFGGERPVDTPSLLASF